MATPTVWVQPLVEAIWGTSRTSGSRDKVSGGNILRHIVPYVVVLTIR